MVHTDARERAEDHEQTLLPQAWGWLTVRVSCITWSTE